MKKIMLLLAFATILVPTLMAQKKGEGHHPHKRNPEMRKEMRQYFETKMYPTLKAEHDAFDAALPGAELTFLQGKRKEAQQLQTAKKDLRKQIRTEIKNGTDRETVRTQFAPQMDNLRSRRKALMESLKPFMETNKALIDKTVEKLKPYQEQWSADRKAIREKYLPAKPEHDKQKHQGKGHQARGPQRKIMRFLLWDGDLKNESADAEMDRDEELSPSFENGMSDEEDFQHAAYPNPAINEVNISFELPEGAEAVKIRIADMSGFVRREMPLTDLQEGKHSIQINIADLDKGQYVYTVDIDGNVVSGQFTKK